MAIINFPGTRAARAPVMASRVFVNIRPRWTEKTCDQCIRWRPETYRPFSPLRPRKKPHCVCQLGHYAKLRIAADPHDTAFYRAKCPDFIPVAPFLAALGALISGYRDWRRRAARPTPPAPDPEKWANYIEFPGRK